jgi:hypothetical protein
VKIPNLIGRDHGIILKIIEGILATSKKSDEKAKKRKELVKYVVEIHNKKDMLIEVKEFYSKHYLFESEISSNLKLGLVKHLVRGPFPLTEGSLADAKINRWQIEKEKERKDSPLIESHLDKAEEDKYKYGYVVYEEIFGIKRFVELKLTDKPMLKYKVDQLLSYSVRGAERSVVRVKLSTRKEKIYK